MIDLHCHMIPWVDDGAENAHVACKMAERSLRSGVQTVILTPHFNLPGSNIRVGTDDHRLSFAMFSSLLQLHGIPLTVLPGAELYAKPSNLRRLLEERNVVPLNHSRYLLVEFDFYESGSEITDALTLITTHRYTPVVAHPERYFCVQEQPSLVSDWFRKGYIIQLNKGSLLGHFGATVKETGLHLLLDGLAHVIASDAHDDYYRPVGFQPLLPLLDQLCSLDYIKLLLNINPFYIIQDRIISN